MGSVGRASSNDEQPRGNPGRLPRWRRFGLERPKAPRRAGGEWGAQPSDPRGHEDQEDERVGHVPCNCKYCLKPSPLLVGRKKNHVQVDGNCKRIARPAAKNDDKEPAPPEEILEALREIPRLERADLLRAYSMLIRDDRLFRSLMALPKDMRKDWLLMETGNQ
ncbi:unnamed protein product [Miscanthus lutarioriparius]|uniref:Uncharacterized protein n=1 Tax=Miscanthus lutarioriparius TaxID=422564 RepID=A0A811RA83_9POAL|nr:unnamed protein product [Miscanthus lutarioriparius]